MRSECAIDDSQCSLQDSQRESAVLSPNAPRRAPVFQRREELGKGEKRPVTVRRNRGVELDAILG